MKQLEAKKVGSLKGKYNTKSNNAIFINMATQSKGSNECYTTKTSSDKLVNHIKDIVDKENTIWLPFNDYHSNIYDSLLEHSYTNLIAPDKDFFTYEPDKYDIIISNPPFKKRTKIFDRLFSFNKPFIMLQPVMFFNNQSTIRKCIEYSNNLAFLCPDERMGFIVNGKEFKRGSAYYSFWLAYGLGISGFYRLPDIDINKKEGLL